MSSADRANEKYLSYHDVFLRRGDVDLLQGPFWLNDQVPRTTALTAATRKRHAVVLFWRSNV